MDRRKALKFGVGALAAGSAGVLTLTSAFKPDLPPLVSSEKVDFDAEKSPWGYRNLLAVETAEMAYENYSKGSCMYGVFSSIVTQLGEKIGEPFRSFPMHMMKYGHGGIGGSGSTCGTLNGAAAVFGLLIDDKKIRDTLTAELFSWYENGKFPNYQPSKPVYDFTPATSTSNSILCHVSTTRWSNESGYRMESNERKERCRRLTAEVAAKTVELLNAYFDNRLATTVCASNTADNCLSCHGSKGKISNTSGKMDCATCHDESVGHQLFGDVHYKMMKKR